MIILNAQYAENITVREVSKQKKKKKLKNS